MGGHPVRDGSAVAGGVEAAAAVAFPVVAVFPVVVVVLVEAEAAGRGNGILFVICGFILGI